jgi:hypothetical protein
MEVARRRSGTKEGYLSSIGDRNRSTSGTGGKGVFHIDDVREEEEDRLVSREESVLLQGATSVVADGENGLFQIDAVEDPPGSLVPSSTCSIEVLAIVGR